MGLQRELAHTGNWLFRWRSFLPITVVVCAVISMLPIPIPKHDGLTADCIEVASLWISFLGLFIRAVTVGHTPAGTSGRNTVGQVAESLNTTGVYSTVRHPLYLGNFLIGFGLACFTLTWWFPLMYTLTFWLYYERIMLAEEAFLRSKFGEQFNVWVQQTPAFIPSWKNYTPPRLKFSMRNVLRREYNTLLQIVVVGFLLEFFGDWFETGRISASRPWWIFLMTGTFIWVCLRTLKRNSSVLEVEGR
ncbi:MAG: isoprenylcysteine carboxylmethyltransferase family protein [Planctomycetaceae bacterium]|jgi:protein-S-isoprenylcysteine O-methyltransferase Ste14